MGIRLGDYYDMSWDEFTMMSRGYDRQRERHEFDVKFIAWHSMVGMHINKVPSFKQFVGGKPTEKATAEQRDLLKREAEEYYRKKNARK